MAQLELERLASELTTARYGRSLRYVSSTESTNDDARAAIEAAAPNGHVIIADAQTRGRGSRGRAWSSPSSTDLYLSIVDRVAVALPELPPLTLAIGLAVADTVDAVLAQQQRPRALVKWPNDVWIDGHKCAGILVEASSGAAGLEALVIGIGLNVNRRSFDADLGQPTSLLLASGRQDEFDRTSILGTLLANTERWVDRFVNEGAAHMAAALTPRLALRGQRASCDGVVGIVSGVARSGALLLETANGKREIIAGRLEAV